MCGHERGAPRVATRRWRQEGFRAGSRRGPGLPSLDSGLLVSSAVKEEPPPASALPSGVLFHGSRGKLVRIPQRTPSIEEREL